MSIVKKLSARCQTRLPPKGSTRIARDLPPTDSRSRAQMRFEAPGGCHSEGSLVRARRRLDNNRSCRR